QFDVASVCNKIGVPDAAGIGLSSAAEIFGLAVEPIGKVTRSVEDEIGTVEEIKDNRHAIDGEQASRFVSLAVEVPIPWVGRQCEKGSLMPIGGWLRFF